MKVWRKLTSAKWSDAWEERLLFLGPERIALNFLPGGKSVRIEVYEVTPREAKLLTTEFGGEIRSLKNSTWQKATITDDAPILIRDQALIVHSEKDLKKATLEYPQRRIILVPGGIAFGTGEHATTASCLRLVADFAKANSDTAWTMLDLGTGSGVLAITARALGATRSYAVDFDPKAVRTAKANVAANQIDKVTCTQKDVTKWTPGKQWSLVTANLFSEGLIAAAPMITASVADGGQLILSGIMRAQEQETLAAFTRLKFCPQHTTRKGKWVTIVLTA